MNERLHYWYDSQVVNRATSYFFPIGLEDILHYFEIDKTINSLAFENFTSNFILSIQSVSHNKLEIEKESVNLLNINQKHLQRFNLPLRFNYLHSIYDNNEAKECLSLKQDRQSFHTSSVNHSLFTVILNYKKKVFFAYIYIGYFEGCCRTCDPHNIMFDETDSNCLTSSENRIKKLHQTNRLHKYNKFLIDNITFHNFSYLKSTDLALKKKRKN